MAVYGTARKYFGMEVFRSVMPMVIINAIMTYPCQAVNAKTHAWSGSCPMRSMFFCTTLTKRKRYPMIAIAMLVVSRASSTLRGKTLSQRIARAQSIRPANVQNAPASPKR